MARWKESTEGLAMEMHLPDLWLWGACMTHGSCLKSPCSHLVSEHGRPTPEMWDPSDGPLWLKDSGSLA